MANDLSDRAMLVDLNISQWSGRKLDRAVSREVADAHNASRDAGNYTKHLLSKDDTARITRAVSRLNETHRAKTLPWGDNGARVLPSALYFDYKQAMRAALDEFTAAVDEFVGRYDTIRNRRARELGTMMDVTEWPHSGEVRSKYNASYDLFPIPQTGDFRVNLGDAEVERIRQDIAASTNRALDGATQDIYRRIGEVLGHMATSLREYDPSLGKQGHPFRDSLVENVRQLAGLLPALNSITNDPDLTDIANRINAELCPTSADVLRTSTGRRQSVAAKAEAILEDIKDFI